VLDFLLRFLDDVLLPGLGLDEANAIGADMVRVRDRLTTVRGHETGDLV